VTSTSGQRGLQRIPYGDGSGIIIRGLHKAFGSNVVLDGVDLDIPRGEARVVLGRSGQGKSVLLKLIVGLLHPDAGSIRVDGEEVIGLSRGGLFGLRRRFGMVFQGGALFDSMTVLENVALGLREHTRLPGAEVRDRAMEALAMVGLGHVGAKLPSELSGGMKKRASLARAIVTQPDYILYDEPTTGLDPITSDAINRMIQRLDRELGVTSIVVTHDMASAFTVGDRFALLNRGQIVFDGSAAEARDAAGGPIRQFIDGSAEGPLEAF
jgi:phospholipid/cholesterol/gamma-HCH transport system ATP-binding protein